VSPGGGAPWNAYGSSLQQRDTTFCQNPPFADVENLDSDGIGGTNLAEINANAQPGWCNPNTPGCTNQKWDKNGNPSGAATPPAKVLLDPDASLSATGARVPTATISNTPPDGPHTTALAATEVVPIGFSVSPRAVALTLTRTQQFRTNEGSVTWLVDGVRGGSEALGTITSAGIYTPPSTAGVHIVTASASGQSADAKVYVTNNPGVFTHHNDNFRTGQNLNETVLTPANVTPATFGKLFSYQLDGIAYASPLYVANVKIPGKGFHNVVYVATEHNTVYAFDADGLSPTPLWQASFINPAGGVTTVPILDVDPDADIGPEVGITSTPVINPATGTLYVVARTKEVGWLRTNYVQRLHALDIATGAEKFGGPVVLEASISGTGLGRVPFLSLIPYFDRVESFLGPILDQLPFLDRVPFNARRQNQRAALLLNNGVVYIAFGSHSDVQPYHGWVLGYNATTLQQTLTFNATPHSRGGGSWQAPAADVAGNIYIATGNGGFTASGGGVDYGDSIVKLSPAGSVLSYFTPYDQSTLDSDDLDLCAGGVILLPDQSGAHPRLLISSGKNATVYVVDRDNLGGFNPNNNSQAVQTLPNIFPNGSQPVPGNFSTPVYFDGSVYFAPQQDTLQAFGLTNGLLSTVPTSRSPENYGDRGGALAISANGTTNGILWAIQRNGPSAPGVLRAYDPANLANELYNSGQAASRDIFDIATKFSVPLVVNGKVFVGSLSQLTVYGLLP
jgi:hypothetical protein